jgi:hypothetical protein
MHASIPAFDIFFQYFGFYWAWFHFITSVKQVWAISSWFSLYYSSFPSPE